MTRSSTKMANEFKSLFDDAVKSLASKEDKNTTKGTSDTIKQLGLKIRKLEEKVTTNEKTIARLSSLEGKIVYLETQDKLKPKKLDNLQQYGCRKIGMFQETKSNSKRANIFLDRGECRSSSRFNTRSIIILDLHKWFT